MDVLTTTVTEELNNFVSWEFLTTFAGICLVLGLIIQFIKVPIDNIVMRLFGKGIRVPTRLVVYVFAVILLNVAQAMFSIWDWRTFGLNFINGVIVAFTTMKAYESIAAKKASK
jgi:hypothetical protein